MFFKKKKDVRPISVEEVQMLTAKGMADKDIIKQLKSEGHSYDEIESAMLQAVKAGVEDEPKGAERPTSASETVEIEGLSDLEQPELEMPDIEFDDRVSPDMIVEELVEGIVEDKWKKFEDRIAEVKKEMSELRLSRQEGGLIVPVENKELETSISEINDRLDNLEARVGGLEKAFKQFLPSLTRNIESLSAMIHEMKSRREEKVYQ
ncbi:MAG: hypothetical protein V1900_00045 [Candidatus Aenigmatarchaeota archaeon]